jgi:hypothetical protein
MKDIVTDSQNLLADYHRNPTYERRVVVFCDVLGWRDHIDKASIDPAKIGDLRRLILQASRTLKLREQLDIRTSTFSDNIVISQALSEKTQALIQQMALLQLAALFNGFLLRGGITIGDIIHDNEVVYGPGLNRAYEIESTIARYPRVVLDPKLAPGTFGHLGDLPVTEDGISFLEPFRPEFFEFLRRGKPNKPNDLLVAIGLPAARLPSEMPPAHEMMKRALNALKSKIRAPIGDKEYEKVTWLFDRIARQLGLPLAKSYPRVKSAE